MRQQTSSDTGEGTYAAERLYPVCCEYLESMSHLTAGQQRLRPTDCEWCGMCVKFLFDFSLLPMARDERGQMVGEGNAKKQWSTVVDGSQTWYGLCG